MAMTTMHLDIVSAEESIFSGAVQHLIVSGQEGELGIYPGHSPLLTGVKPGQVVAKKEDGETEVFYVSGGMLEVQPSIATLLADTVIRGDEIDETQAEEAKAKALEMMQGKKTTDIDYQQALVQLTEASAQIKAAKDLHKYVRKHKIG